MNRIIRYLFVLLTTVGLSANISAQWPDYHVRLYDETNGLLSNPVRLIRDHDGFVWIMYNTRIQRFDGKNVKNFFPGNSFLSILCDRSKRIWLNTSSELFIFKNAHDGFQKIPFDTSGRIQAGQFIQLEGYEPWLFTSSGIFEWDNQKATFHKIELPNFHVKLPLSTAVRRFYSKGEDIYFFNNDSIYHYDVKAKQMQQCYLSGVVGLFALSKNEVVVTLSRNITVRVNLNTGDTDRIRLQKDLNQGHSDFLFLEDVVEYAPGRYFFSTHNGMAEYVSNEKNCRLLNLYHKGRPIELSNFYQDLYLDDEKKVWIVNVGSGLIRFDPFAPGFGLIRSNEPNVDKSWPNTVRNFAEDEKGNFWISTSNGFGYLDLKTNYVTMYPPVEGAADRLNNPSVRGLAYDGHKLIMGTTRGGVWLYDPVQKKYGRPVYSNDSDGKKTQQRLESNFIRSISKVPGSKILIAGSGGLFYLEGTGYRAHEFRPNGQSENYFCLYTDEQKRIWAGADQHLLCLDSNFNILGDLSFKKGVTSICQWNKDEFLVGTNREGLYLVSITADGLTKRKENPLFDGADFRFIIRDSLRKFWISTDIGFSQYDPTTKQNIIYDYADNIQGNLFSVNAHWRHSNGLYFLGGYNGINYFIPERIKGRSEKPQPIITRISINGNDSDYHQHDTSFRLRHFQNSLDVEFVAPYFGNPSHLQYRYRLTPSDTGWVSNANSNSIRINSLNPGSYKFYVAASLDGIEWSESSEHLSFTIVPPFWKRGWFLVMLLISVIAITALLIRSRLEHLRKQQAQRIEKMKIKQADAEKELQLSNLNHDLAASRLTALRAQMNPHFIFNALNSVQQYMLQGNVTEANKYLSKFSKLQREILNHSDKDFIPLEKELELLNLYLQLEQLRFDDTFKYCIETDESMDPDEIKIPPMLVQPFAENAIWHGLMPKQGERKLEIKFKLKDDQLLICTIRDNGIGREAAGRLRQATGNGTKHVSKGLSLVYERLKILEQQYDQPFEVTITDLDQGTLVTLILFAGH